MGVSPVITNTNLAQFSKFILAFDRLPWLQYFCQKVNLPGIQFGHTLQQTPFIDAPVPGDKMIYETLKVSFLVDEPLYGWTTIQDWIRGLAFPDTFQEYANLSMQQKIQMRGSRPQYSDATLTVLTNKNNPVLTVQFKDLFPVQISSIDFDTELPATNIVTGEVAFMFTNYEINRISNNT
jgi:hypothetical protein